MILIYRNNPLTFAAGGTIKRIILDIFLYVFAHSLAAHQFVLK